MKTSSLSFVSSLFLATAIQAAPIYYDEAIDGDIDAEALLFSSGFNFDIGINVVKGHTSASFGDFGGTDDIDAFRFIIPFGTQLKSLRIDYSNINFGSSVAALPLQLGIEFDIEIRDKDTGLITGFDGHGKVTFIDDTPGSLDLFTAELLLGTGTYTTNLGIGLLAHDSACPGGHNDNCSVGFDYTLSYEISEVPIAATFYLFVSGLVGMIGIARRKKAV